MTRKPTDQSRQPCLLPSPEAVVTASRPAERRLTPKQQVRDVQPRAERGLPLPFPFLTTHRGANFCVCVCVYVSGDDIEREQDTVLQLQEVIEQLRNVFPSEPGESGGGWHCHTPCNPSRQI